VQAARAATLRLYGAGASPKKFARLAAQQVNGVLRGQYSFAGAGQTGRMTSRGAQIQNLTRDVLGPDGAAEAALVDAIADGCGYAELVDHASAGRIRLPAVGHARPGPFPSGSLAQLPRSFFSVLSALSGFGDEIATRRTPEFSAK